MYQVKPKSIEETIRPELASSTKSLSEMSRLMIVIGTVGLHLLVSAIHTSV
jgi:hypothetical protein